MDLYNDDSKNRKKQKDKYVWLIVGFTKVIRFLLEFGFQFALTTFLLVY